MPRPDGEMGHRSGTAPHYEDCDSLDCPCYRNGQEDVLTALRVLARLGLNEARDAILQGAEFGSQGGSDV